MPPFHSRSTGAFRIAFMSSFGVIESASESMCSAAFTCGVSGIVFAERGWMPPPAEIRLLS
jgi:hypothetical protein